MIPAALCLLGLAALGAGGWLFWQARRTLRRLDAMLASAIDGGFVEEDYDESALSSLESRMARVLHGSAAANRALAEEQAAVQSLISDISHQARTPMANVLLYASLLEESGLTEAQRARLAPLQAQAVKLHFLLENLLRASCCSWPPPKARWTRCWNRRRRRPGPPPCRKAWRWPCSPAGPPPVSTPAGPPKPSTIWWTTP